MHTNYATLSVSDSAIDQEASDETIKLIRKLRWIGREEEARGMEHELSQLPVRARGSVLAEPFSTD